MNDLLLSLGLFLIVIGGFVELCIFIFKGPLRDGVIAAIILVTGSILFFYGVRG
jgi:hypothetical protein